MLYTTAGSKLLWYKSTITLEKSQVIKQLRHKTNFNGKKSSDRRAANYNNKGIFPPEVFDNNGF